MAYFVILVLVALLSPLLISLASKQGKKHKNRLLHLCLLILTSQILLGFFNWETFEGPGRTGFGLARAFPNSLLWTFFAVSAIQIVFLLSGKYSLKTTAVAINFGNSILFFLGLIKTSNIIGTQMFSIPTVTCAFLVLIGNVVGLILINNDRKLISKLPWS